MIVETDGQGARSLVAITKIDLSVGNAHAPRTEQKTLDCACHRPSRASIIFFNDNGVVTLQHFGSIAQLFVGGDAHEIGTFISARGSQSRWTMYQASSSKENLWGNKISVLQQ